MTTMGTGASESCSFAQNNIADFTQWHVFTCIFDFDKIVWQIDGNTVRVINRYKTLNGLPINCGESISTGTYFQEKSFPMEQMNIILNLAIQSGNNGPDPNTTFPNSFEVDYVRFYKRGTGPTCDGCLDHLIYENTINLPNITRASNYIQAKNNTVVKSGKNVTFKAPKIELMHGFSVEQGATFLAKVEECNLINYTDVPIVFIGSNAIDNFQINKCINPIYIIEATGVLFYTLEIHNLAGQLIFTNNGSPSSNYIALWNTSNIASSWYSVHLELVNCSNTEIYNYSLLVNQGNCRMAQPDTTEKQIEETFHEEHESLRRKNEMVIYPNPANENLTVLYFSFKSQISTLVILDNNGKELFREQRQDEIGTNKNEINLSQFPCGKYILILNNETISIEEKFIVNR